ncbi:MAG: hypothetical protein K2P81_07370 [Bacteriovoracaceae bacterium]|nr:hypothetical protein [Bacteriovoracaceae bacterium]
MKYFVLTLSLLLSLSSFAQDGGAGTIALTLSPFATATRVIESGFATITAGLQTALAPFATTSASIEARGVAGKEQLKDELIALDRDMQAGLVKSIDDVRQPSLKEIFSEIASDENEIEKINELVPTGTEVHRIATVVTLKLFY